MGIRFTDLTTRTQKVYMGRILKLYDLHYTIDEVAVELDLPISVVEEAFAIIDEIEEVKDNMYLDIDVYVVMR